MKKEMGKSTSSDIHHFKALGWWECIPKEKTSASPSHGWLKQIQFTWWLKLRAGQWIHLVTTSSKVKIKYEQLEQTIIYLTLEDEIIWKSSDNLLQMSSYTLTSCLYRLTSKFISWIISDELILPLFWECSIISFPNVTIIARCSKES